jgi:WD40 repeat protein
MQELVHRYDVSKITISGDGKYIATNIDSNWFNMNIWRADTGEHIHTLRGHKGGARCLEWNPEGTLLYSAGHEYPGVYVCTVDEGTPPCYQESICQDTCVTCMKISPDGRKIACAEESNVMICSTQTGEELLVFKGHKIHRSDAQRFPGDVSCVAWSSDSKMMASGGYSGKVLVWDAESGTQVMEPLTGHTDYVMALAFNKATTLLVTASKDTTVMIWKLCHGMGGDATVMHVLNGHTDTVCSVSLSPNDARMVSASKDETVRVWDLASGMQLRIMRSCSSHKVRCAVWSPDGQYIVSGLGQSAVVWRLDVQVCMCVCMYVYMCECV